MAIQGPCCAIKLVKMKGKVGAELLILWNHREKNTECAWIAYTCSYMLYVYFFLIYMQSMQDYYHGDLSGAARKEKIARKWIICSIVTGVGLIVGIVLLVIMTHVIVFMLTRSKEEN